MAGETVLCIELKCSGVKTSLVEVGGEFIATRFVPHPKINTADVTFSLMTEEVTRLVAENRKFCGNILGAGVAVPGNYHVQTGKMLRSPLSYLENVCIRSALDEKMPYCIWIENFSNAAAAAEFWLGDFNEKSSFCSLWLDSEIGASFILEGHLFQGEFGTAGDISSLRVSHEEGVSFGELVESYRGKPEKQREIEVALAWLIHQITSLTGIFHFVMGGHEGMGMNLQPGIEQALKRLCGKRELPCDFEIKFSPFQERAVSLGLSYLVQNRIAKFTNLTGNPSL